MKTALGRIRLLALCCVAGAAPASGAGPDEGWKADPDLVNRLSGQRPGINYREEKVPRFSLPDPLITQDGRRIESATQWMEIRRPEILELFKTEMYGRLPGGPEFLSFELYRNDPTAMEGTATLKLVRITCGQGDRDLSFDLVLFLPNRVPRPVPVFLLINHRAPSNIDPTRETMSGFWPAEQVVAEGFGIAAFQATVVDPDEADGFKNGIHGVIDQGERTAESWATLAAWAWGASRALDYFEWDRDVDATRVAVVGHSRGGKASLWAGAADPRFALVVSNDSGCGGAALSRRRFGETVARINRSFPHWFCDRFSRYNDREDELPIDQHLLISLMAPRAVYVASASQDLWADPRGEFLSLVHAGPVFNLWELDSFTAEDFPPVNTPVQAGRMAYHIRQGAHNLTPYDWGCYTAFARDLWSEPRPEPE